MLLIYLPINSSRSKYIFDQIFIHELGINYSITTNTALFKDFKEAKINYSEQRLQDECYVKASSFLSEKFISNRDIIVSEKEGTKILFPSAESCDLGFDIFSASFYMLSRYEEYLPFSPDKYGRYDAQESLAYRNNFLQIPVVDRWLNFFKDLLRKKFPSLQFRDSTFKVTLTYDIDVAYKFKGRSFYRNAGSIIKDILKLDFKNIKDRLKTLIKRIDDPWDNYDYLEEIITTYNFESIFFFLLGDLSGHDRNINHKSVAINQLISKIKSFSEIGIHPSFTSSVFTQKIILEKQRLEKIANKKIIKSRQHFLKFTLPGTYNALSSAGISEDYSMGFPNAPGFRAGTSKPFYFYDLKNEKTSTLKIFPTTFMEGNFMSEKKLHPDKVLKDIFKLIDEVRKVNGTFISIWHNHTISNTNEFKDWRHIHDQMISKLSEK
jgi:hypothetical protein